MAGMVALSSRARGLPASGWGDRVRLGPPRSGIRKSTRATSTGSGASNSRAIASASSPENGSTSAARSRASPEARSARASLSAPARMRPASAAAPASASRVTTSGSATSGMGTTLPSGRRTVIPSAQARAAAARPTATSWSLLKSGFIRRLARGRHGGVKIYTKTGDGGETGLFGGPRVKKCDPRVEAYGEVDELNAALGLVRAGVEDPELEQHLARIQDELFCVGAELATPHGAKARSAIPPVQDRWTA